MNIPKQDYVNVKIPVLYVEIIDRNLELDKPLQSAGFRGRAHFVSEAVREKLMQLNLVSQSEQKKIEILERKRLHWWSRFKRTSR